MKIIKFIKRNLKLITIITVMIIISAIAIVKYSLLQSEEVEVIEDTSLLLEEQEQLDEEPSEENIPVVEKIFVDIKGEVALPGVYEIENNKKVIDVIGLAGGFTEKADTSLINLAKQVTNEMVIIIYSKEEVKKALKEDEIAKVVDKQCICPEIKNDACLNNENQMETDNDNEQSNSSTKLVNLNTATLEELQTLDGVGESKAKAIIEYRESLGRFKNIEELKQVSGIGEALYEKIKDRLTV